MVARQMRFFELRAAARLNRCPSPVPEDRTYLSSIISSTIMPRTITTPAPTSSAPQIESISAESIVRMLNSKNWDNYWQKVNEQVTREVDAYRYARARSLVTSQRRVMV